jgi:hypothetical protein
MRKGIQLLFILLTFILSNCNKSSDDNQPPAPIKEENKLKTNAFIVDTIAIATIDSASLSLLKVHNTKAFSIGDIL